ncbi:MAG: glutamine--tRNA ligase, partial [Deltaproteobacteria bacterium]|nr:glutamine--tRNA ligase [Deltaproteobacteria bacterium]
LNLTYTVMSKRKLLQLVEQKHVSGWDDPRMPTIAGLRRRGYTPESIREFCTRIGVAKNLSTVDVALLEACVRDDLDPRSPRVMCVQKPLEVVIETYPENEVEELDAPYWPQGTEASASAPAHQRGARKLPFSRRLLIEQDDFAETPPKGWKRLSPGAEVRLRHGYIVTCTRVEKDASGAIVRIVCSHDPASRGGVSPTGKRIEGTIHWVSADHARDVEVRVYDRLFKSETPGEGDTDWLADLNPASLSVVRAKAEPSLAGAKPGERYQFERLGFYYVDPDSKDGAPVFNRTVPLKDSWARVTAPSAKPPSSKATSPAVPSAKRVAAAAVTAEVSPEAKALMDAHGVGADVARALVTERSIRALFDAAVATPDGKAKAKAVASVLANDLLGELRSRRLEAAPFDGAAVVELVAILEAGTISSKQAKDVLVEMIASGKGARAIVEEKGMKQIASADALGPIVDQVLAANAELVAKYKAGNANVFGALVGMAMKQTKGQGNPKLVSDLLKAKLGG